MHKLDVTILFLDEFYVLHSKPAKQNCNRPTAKFTKYEKTQKVSFYNIADPTKRGKIAVTLM